MLQTCIHEKNKYCLTKTIISTTKLHKAMIREGDIVAQPTDENNERNDLAGCPAGMYQLCCFYLGNPHSK